MIATPARLAFHAIEDIIDLAFRERPLVSPIGRNARPSI
jgi:hypothetical protein